MVVFCKMVDKQSQQRRGRADGANRSVADREAVEKDRALAPETAETSPGWPALDREASCVGRDSLDSAERCWLAGSTGEISPSFDLLAAFAGWGGTGRLVEHLASVSERVERTPATGMERVVSGRQFRSGKKGAQKSEKPSRARAQSGWWWSTATVFLWEVPFTLRPRRKCASPSRRSRRSA